MSDGDGLSDGCSALDNTLDDYHKLPAIVKRRVRALKKLQYETVKIDAAFYKELLGLELKYDVDHQRIFEKRREIISGTKEPNDDECDWPSDDEHPGAEGDEVEKLCDDIGKKANVDGTNGTESKVAGIPEFWLKTLRNVDLLDEIIQEHDIKILEHLTDIKCALHYDDPGFTLEFHFSPNEFFTNKVLSKRYHFNYDISPDQPFDYEGPEIVRTKGCSINWNPGKNVTVKTIKKVQKKKGGGAKRTVTRNVQEDSFFNFFDPPTQTLSEDLDEDVQMLLEADFKLGQFIRDSIVPRAVLFFTGEAVISESDDDDDDDEDEDDDDESDEEEENESPRHHHGRHHRPGGHSKPSENSAPGEQPECKQQ